MTFAWAIIKYFCGSFFNSLLRFRIFHLTKFDAFLESFVIRLPVLEQITRAFHQDKKRLEAISTVLFNDKLKISKKKRSKKCVLWIASSEIFGKLYLHLKSYDKNGI